MNSSLFAHDGHIQSYLFYPPCFGGIDYWETSLTKEEKKAIYDHMKGNKTTGPCSICCSRELEAVLKWAELRPRATMRELIPIADTGGTSIAAIRGAVLPLVEQLEKTLGQVKKILNDEIPKKGGIQ